MKVSAINNNVHFGHKLIIDSGASNQKKGSLKVAIVSDETREIVGKSKGGVACPNGFNNSFDYINGMVTRIKDIYKDKDVAGYFQKLSEKDKALSGMMIYVPGITVDNKTPLIPNLHTQSGESLTNIQYDAIGEMLKTSLPKQGVQVADNLKIVATNDMIGAGSAIAKHLATNTKLLKDGYKATFLMAGGGLGAGEIEVLGKKVYVKNYEGGHARALGSGKNFTTLESFGASSTALIKNFGKALNFDKEKIATLIGTGNAKIVTQHNIITNDEVEIKALENTNLFEIIKNPNGFSNFTLKGVDEVTHQKACKKAISRFASAIGMASANKIIEGTNNVIITGPLAKGLDGAVKDNPKLYGAESLKELVSKKTDSFLDAAGKAMKNAYNFSFIDNIPVVNNTQGGLTALEGTFKKGRGNWLEIPMQLLRR